VKLGSTEAKRSCHQTESKMSDLETTASVPLSPDLSSPATPEPPEKSNTPDDDPGCSFHDCDSTPLNHNKGKKRHRRAKGKKKKQKTCLMITNEDGTNSTANNSKQQKKVYLRPSNNPLLKAPKNSTQFIIDDHENSNLFWNFGSQKEDINPRYGSPATKEDKEVKLHSSAKENQPRHQGMAVMPGQFFGLSDTDRFSPDDDNFWAAYSERDFESVYETAHQEEIYSWERGKIVDEISYLEIRQKQLIDMLSQIDPLIYLQKLQHELLELQEENRQLKLINVSERMEKESRKENSSSSRLPDSTTEKEELDCKDTHDSESEESEDEGGCSSGCCLADNRSEGCVDIGRLDDLADEDVHNPLNEEENNDDSIGQEEVAVSKTTSSVDEASTQNLQEDTLQDGENLSERSPKDSEASSLS